MAGGNIAAGLGLIILALFVHFLTAFMVSEGATVESAPAGCTTGQNTTTCSQVSGGSFFSSLVSITFSGFSGITVVDGAYLLVVGGLFIMGVILLAFGIVGAPFGGG